MRSGVSNVLPAPSQGLQRPRVHPHGLSFVPRSVPRAAGVVGRGRDRRSGCCPRAVEQGRHGWRSYDFASVHADVRGRRDGPGGYVGMRNKNPCVEPTATGRANQPISPSLRALLTRRSCTGRTCARGAPRPSDDLRYRLRRIRDPGTYRGRMTEKQPVPELLATAFMTFETPSRLRRRGARRAPAWSGPATPIGSRRRARTARRMSDRSSASG